MVKADGNEASIEVVTSKYDEVIEEAIKYMYLDSIAHNSFRLALSTAKSTGDPADVVAVIKAYKAKGQSTSERCAGIDEIKKRNPELAFSLTKKLNAATLKSN